MKILKSNLAETNKQKRIEHNKNTATKRKNNNPVVAKFDLMSEFSSGVDFSKSKMQKTSWTYDLFPLFRIVVLDCIRYVVYVSGRFWTLRFFNVVIWWGGVVPSTLFTFRIPSPNQF